MFLFLMQQTPPTTTATNIREARLSGLESAYKCTFNSIKQRHSAELVRKSRTKHSLCSRFADVLSLECTPRQLSGPMNGDHGLLCTTRSLVMTSSGQLPAANTLTKAAASFDPMHTVTATGGLMLNSPSRRQFSFAADAIDPMAAARSRCNSSMNVDMPLSPLQSGPRKTVADFQSNIVLAPITVAGRRPQRRASDLHRVS